MDFARLGFGQGDLFWPDPQRLLPGDCHFNPSLLEWHGRLWMIYRRIPSQSGHSVLEWPRELGLCALQADLHPDAASNIDVSSRITDLSGARRWHADARFFMRRGQPWIWFHDNTSPYVLPFDPDALPEVLTPQAVDLVDRPRRAQERNWGFFEDGAFKAVYSIDPHVVLQFDHRIDGWCGTSVAETRGPLNWSVSQWGTPHGGTCPVLVGDCWFSFFHSNTALAPDGTRRVYRVGFYGFEADPPHRIRYMSRQPLLSADTIPGERSFYGDYSVVYPSGAVYADGHWLVSLGIHDRRLALTRFAHEDLLAQAETR